ncbi:MAG TPA: DoxX family protein [Ktedonobacterales bacterium]
MLINWALLILRVVVGLTLAAHGAQKLFGWFGGPGFARLMQGQQAQGFRPAWIWSPLVVLGELGGGLSLAFGFLTPLGAAGVVGAMTMAILKVHWKNGFFNGNRGIEFPLQLLAAAAAVGLAGPGAYSLDALLNLHLPQAQLFGALALAAVIVDIIGLLISRSAAAPPKAPARAV